MPFLPLFHFVSRLSRAQCLNSRGFARFATADSRQKWQRSWQKRQGGRQKWQGWQASLAPLGAKGWPAGMGWRNDGGYAVVKVQMPTGIRTYVLIGKCTIGGGMAQGQRYSRQAVSGCYPPGTCRSCASTYTRGRWVQQKDRDACRISVLVKSLVFVRRKCRRRGSVSRRG